MRRRYVGNDVGPGVNASSSARRPHARTSPTARLPGASRNLFVKFLAHDGVLRIAWPPSLECSKLRPSSASNVNASPESPLGRTSTTYCMGYWRVPENAKRPPEHYLALIPNTIRMLGHQNLLFFAEEPAIHAWVERLCAASDIKVICRRKAMTQLPTLDAAAQIVRQTESYGRGTSMPARFNDEKGLWHYWRDLLGSGESCYQNILAIWLSKVCLVHEAMREDPFGSGQFAWIDSTAARFNGQRKRWNFAELDSRPLAIHHYSSTMRKFGQPLSLNASFLKGCRVAWADLLELYRAELARIVCEQYPNDEETILHNIKEQRPGLFLTVDLECPGGAATIGTTTSLKPTAHP